MFAELLSRLATTGFRKGATGSRTWLVIAAVAAGLRLLRYMAHSGEDVVYRTLVVEGDQFEITTRPSGKR
jgi:hypothetical protein